MRKRFLKLIEREAEHARSGQGGRIRVKFNGLADKELIGALYSASQAGVEIDLIVRGICALRPGVPGLSERIRVISILGQFLEHARIYHFENGGEPEFYIGSADWRPRNLRRRVEVVTPVADPAGCARLHEILDRELDDSFAWHMNSDGSYTRRPAPIGVDQRSAQEYWVEGLG
jgi:polyphosphate kinase